MDKAFKLLFRAPWSFHSKHCKTKLAKKKKYIKINPFFFNFQREGKTQNKLYFLIKYLNFQHILLSLDSICYYWYWTTTEIMRYLFTLQTEVLLRKGGRVPIGCIEFYSYSSSIHFWKTKSIPLMQYLFCFTELYWIAGCDKHVLNVFKKKTSFIWQLGTASFIEIHFQFMLYFPSGSWCTRRSGNRFILPLLCQKLNLADPLFMESSKTHLSPLQRFWSGNTWLSPEGRSLPEGSEMLVCSVFRGISLCSGLCGIRPWGISYCYARF